MFFIMTILTLLEDILHGSAVVMVEDVVDEVVVDDVVVVKSGKSGTM